MTSRHSKLILVAVLAVLVASFFLFDLHQYLTLDYLKSQQRAFADFYAANRLLTIALYFSVYVLVTALSLPGAAVMTLAGGALLVNAKVDEGGYLKAELRDPSGNTVEPYALRECRPITRDALEGRVSWRQRETIEHPPATSLRLVFELKNAKLYSFWIE